MAKRVLRLRHATTVEADAFTGLEGEITIDMQRMEMRVHDALQAGGFAAGRADLTNVLAATLATKLANQTLAGITLTTPKTDTLAEQSAAAGVTVDGMLIKDGVFNLSSPISNATWLQILAAIASGDIPQAKIANLVSDLSTLTSGKQPLDATLTALAAVTVAANKLIYATGADAFSTTDFTADGRSLVGAANYAAMRTLLSLVVGTDVQAYDADTLKGDVADQVITGGVRITSLSLGTISSGTVTPDPGDRPMQHYTNNGAHTLAPGANAGYYILDITNAASASTITTSGWTSVKGAFTTTNGHKFRCYCTIGNAGSTLDIRPFQ